MAALPRTPGRAGGWALLPVLTLAVLVLAGCTNVSPVHSHRSTSTARVTIAPRGSSRIDPLTPIRVTVTGGRLRSVSVGPPGRAVVGRFDATRTAWTSTTVLGYGRSYRISAEATGSSGGTARASRVVTVIDPLTTYPAVFPVPAGAASIGVGLPLSVVFLHNPPPNQIAVQRALHVTTSPPQPGAWYWISRHEVHYRPQTYWTPGTKITLTAKLYGVDLGGGIYGATDRTVRYAVHGSWIAKANGSTDQMQVFHDGGLIRTMPVSMGRDALPTHLGAHVISAKQSTYTMDSCTYGLCGSGRYRSSQRWVERISEDGEFVHENPATVAQQGHANVSHGCINLGAADAQWFYRHFGVGDVVEVYNSNGQTLPLDDRFGDWAVPWSRWQAGNAAGS